MVVSLRQILKEISEDRPRGVLCPSSPVSKRDNASEISIAKMNGCRKSFFVPNNIGTDKWSEESHVGREITVGWPRRSISLGLYLDDPAIDMR